MAGLARRPNWVDKRTPKIAALNTWKAKEEQSKAVSRITLKERRTRRFADGWYLQMRGHKAQLRIHAHDKAIKRDANPRLTSLSKRNNAPKKKTQGMRRAGLRVRSRVS